MDRALKEALKWKKTVRVIAYPFEQIRRRYNVWKYRGTEDSLYVKSLHNTHAGERCFVIGNGPSLAAEDLDKLHDARLACFASNRIYQIYPKTRWRPTYYISMDPIFLKNIEDVRHSGDYPKFIDYPARVYGRKPEDNIHYLCNFANFKIDMYEQSHDTLSEDVSKYSTMSGTVTVNAIELAIYMGFKTIYLLGVDNNYTHKRNKDGSVIIDPSVKSSYFPGGEPQKSEGISVQPVEIANGSYEMAKRFAQSHGAKIFNATRGGKLEVFERVDFDSLLD